jgi:hypothetical protein
MTPETDQVLHAAPPAITTAPEPVAADCRMVDEALEVYCRPTPWPLSGLGWDYAETPVLRRDESVAPQGAPGPAVAVDDLLP